MSLSLKLMVSSKIALRFEKTRLPTFNIVISQQEQHILQQTFTVTKIIGQMPPLAPDTNSQHEQKPVDAPIFHNKR